MNKNHIAQHVKSDLQTHDSYERVSFKVKESHTMQQLLCDSQISLVNQAHTVHNNCSINSQVTVMN